MWRRDDVQLGKKYRVGLIAGLDGSRLSCLLEEAAPTDHCDFITPVIDDVELLKSRHLEAIIKQHGVLGGTRIVIDAHAIWFTEVEYQSLFDAPMTGRPVPWFKGIEPNRPPK